MKRIQTFCCCASTRTGAIFTAVVGIILSIITIILLWIAPKNLISLTLTFNKDWDKQLSDLYIPQIIVTISLLFTIMICSLLIAGVKKRRSWFMLPFIILGLVLAIGLLISILHTAITYYLIEEEDYTIQATVILVGGIIYLCLFLYAWAVVFSHYLDIRDEEERGRYRKAPYRR